MSDVDGYRLSVFVASAVSRHITFTRRNGVDVPDGVFEVAELFIAAARRRQSATPLGDAADCGHGDDMATTAPPLLTKGDVATALACSTRQVERLVRCGKLRAVHVGGCVRVQRADLDAYINGLVDHPRSFRDTAQVKKSA